MAEKKTTEDAAKASLEKDDAQVEAEEATQDETEQAAAGLGQDEGFIGTEVDLTPNENYTVQGVTEGGNDVPEAQANKASAQAAATNPEAGKHPLSDH